MKKIVSSIVLIALLFGLIACGSKAGASNAEPTTDGGKLASKFLEEIEKSSDVVTVGEALAATGIAGELGCMGMEVEEGYLNGFKSEVTGFEKGYVFSPVIGSIPMIGYVFEAADDDSAKKLEQKLKDLADPRWNICTEADETVTQVSGKYVFFTMCPAPSDVN